MLDTTTRCIDGPALARRIQARQACVGVVGLGYAGLPLAVECARAGFTTVGFDVDQDKVSEINAGRSTVYTVDDDAIRSPTKAGLLQAETNPRRIESLDCVVICVPTPLTSNGEPDTHHVEDALDTVATNLAPQSLIVLQSSSYVGCTRQLALPKLQSGDREVGRDFYLAYAPERIDPGNHRYGVNNTPKLVGGMTPTCSEIACSFYQRFVETVVPVASPEIAEMAKLVENSFRFINISFVNELAVLCDRLGLDVWQVINAAATKPFAFLPHYPGPGVGGDCIPVMPRYLQWSARRGNVPLEIVSAATRVNERMPEFVVEKLARLLWERDRKLLNHARILIAGVTYKPDVADLRNASSLQILTRLRALDIDSSYYDPLVPVLRTGDDEMLSTDLSDLARYDAVILVTPHRTIDYDRLVANSALILDTQNALAGWSAPNIVPL